jgi:hypothetical protein
VPEVERDGPLAIVQVGGWFWVTCQECQTRSGHFRHRRDAEDEMDGHTHGVDNPTTMG